MLVSPGRAKPCHAQKKCAAYVPDSVHSVLVEQAPGSLVAEQIWVRTAKPVTGEISQPLREFDSFICPESLRKGKPWMNAFIAGHVVAIRAWWRRNFQSAARNIATAGATARSGHSSSCYSVAGCLSVPAPAIPPTRPTNIAITATATDTAANKRKPSIVRVIRVRRLHRARDRASTGHGSHSFTSGFPSARTIS